MSLSVSQHKSARCGRRLRVDRNVIFISSGRDLSIILIRVFLFLFLLVSIFIVVLFIPTKRLFTLLLDSTNNNRRLNFRKFFFIILIGGPHVNVFWGR